MKKINSVIALVLVTALSALAFACAPAKAPLDPDAAFEKILSEVKFAETLEDASSYAEYTLGELPEGAEARIYTAGGQNVDCAMLIKVQNEADISVVENAVKAYIESMMDEAQHYDPAQLPKLEKARTKVLGTSYIVVVTDDIEAVNRILY